MYARRMMRSAFACALVVGIAGAGCKPSSVNDAEAKGNVGYLVANGSPEAVAALGRLADKNEKARSAMKTRAENDLNAYIAAWSAAQRGARWGSELLKAGLAQPSRAELAASAMTRGDPKLAEYVPSFSGALVAAGPKEPRVIVAAMLASTGAVPAIVERLHDPNTRANMCRGLGAPDASAAARQALLSEPEESRNDPACIDAIVGLAKSDDATLVWLASSGEPGLLSGAGKGESMPCARLAQVWTEAFVTRPPASYASLAVPLAHAIKRCPAVMDGVLDAALAKSRATAPLVVGGVDPYGPETRRLTKTCKALGSALRSMSGRTRDRAADTLANGCKPPRR
jgi:hypothetical protein